MASIVVPNLLHVMLWSRLQLSGPEWTERILKAFESVPELMPTHWGPDERGRSKFSRADAVAYAADQQPRVRVPTFRRTIPPAYLAFPGTDSSGCPFAFKVDLQPHPRAEDVVPIYNLGDALASQMEAEFGFVHPAFIDEGCRGFGAWAGYKFHDYSDSGPRGVAVRTWLGPHVVGLLGRERLARVAEAGAVIKDTPWGGVRLDLGNPPWEADCRTLIARQAQVMDLLRDSGVFGDYSGLAPRPGPGWVRPTPVAPSDPPEPRLQASPVVERLKQAVLLEQEVANVDVQGLDLKYIDLSGLNAPGLRATNAHLEGALLTEARLIEATLTGAVLDDANLDGANLSVASCDGISLRNASLLRVIFAFAFCSGADLTGADLTEANLEETGFAESRLDRAVLRTVRADGASFARASLVGADLSGGQFVGAVFRDADLTQADLSAGDFTAADFRGAKLAGVQWQGAKLDQAQLDQAQDHVNGTSC